MDILLKKNDKIIIDIEDIGINGEGIGRYQSMVIFVSNSLPGDKVEVNILKVKKSFAYAKLSKVIEASNLRTEARCEHAHNCAACQLQHLKYEEGLKWKKKDIEEKLKRIAGLDDFEIDGIIPAKSLSNYRNKGQFPLSSVKGKVKIGYFARQSHNVIDINYCDAQKKITSDIINEFRSFVEKNKISVYDEKTNKGLLRHLIIKTAFYNNDEIALVIVINEKKFKNSNLLVKHFTSKFPNIVSIDINVNLEKTNVIMSNHTYNIFGKSYIEDYLFDLKFRISAESFYQTNPEETLTLYSKALEFADLDKNDIAFDLFSGIGTISLFLAQKCKEVYAIEYVEKAVEDAKINAKINNINNINFIAGDASKSLKKLLDEGKTADVLVIDPPRKGCDEELLKSLENLSAKKIVYISCNPATFARDAKFLIDINYSLKKVLAVDLFPNTVSTELVSLFIKNE